MKKVAFILLTAAATVSSCHPAVAKQLDCQTVKGLEVCEVPNPAPSQVKVPQLRDAQFARRTIAL